MRLRPLIKDIVNDVNLYPNVEINNISTNSRAIKRGVCSLLSKDQITMDMNI